MITWLFQLALAAELAGAALASPIVYTMTATATGTLAGQAFSNAAVTVTSFADTSQISVTPNPSPGGDDYRVTAGSSFITIAGTSATFIDAMFWEDPQPSGDIIFGDAVLGRNVLGFTKLLSGLESYDLTSSFGPVSQNFDFVTSFFDGFNNIPTNLGSLSLVASNDTFTAVADVPEPTPFIATLTGLVAMLAVRLKRGRLEGRTDCDPVAVV